MRLIDYFDVIYILNLPDRVDRKNGMIKELKRVDMHYPHNKIIFYPAKKFSDPYPFHRVGSKGCYLSILDMLENAISSGLTKVLIIQDDLNFIKNFYEVEELAISELQKTDWDVIQFGYCPQFGFAPKEVKNKVILENTTGDVTGAHFVGYNFEKSTRIYDFLHTLSSRKPGDPKGGPMPIDGALHKYPKEVPDAKRLIAIPSLGYQRSSMSDCDIKKSDRLPVLKEIKDILRYLKNTTRFILDKY